MARIRHNGNGAKKKQQAPRPKAPSPAGHEPETADTQSAGPERTHEENRPPAAKTSPIFQTFAETTSHVVQQAASILEEEIAAGIVAARQIEDKFLNTQELRSGKPDEILQRFRRDAHDVIDMVVDVVGAAARNASRMAQRAISIRGGSRGAAETSGTPVITLTQPVNPGETGEVSLVIENDGDAATEPFEFRPTDLINAAGDCIPAHAVQFDVKSISVGPHQNQRVVVRVTPPASTPSGLYSGLIQTSRADQLRAVLTVTVAVAVA
jgi:hypothetical protein